MRLDKEKSIGRDGTHGSIDSENIYIEGDNLDALKLLQETYLGKIKMIYIDPPYNTGNDFIYEDNFSQSAGEYADNSGQTDEEGNRLVQNSESNGRYHTDWLNMMYPRLKLAKDLLSEDGAIFISIDDNEQDNLKKICDEVFGSDNYISSFVWKRRTSSAMSSTKISIDHEYVVCYKKSCLREFRGIEKDYKDYSNPDNDPRGDWTTGDLTVGMNADQRPNQYYTLTDPATGQKYEPSYSRVWSYTPDSMEKLIRDNYIVFPSDPSKRPMKKRFKSELKDAYNPFSSWMTNVGLNTEGNREFSSLFDKKSYFSYAKPISLIRSLIEQVVSANDIVLDFFSGSGTTAQAILQSNAENNIHLKYILVQLPELTDEKSEAYRDGYRTITDIGEERIRRAGKKIKKETGADIDYGFRCFKVDSSNMKDVYYRPVDLEQGQLSLLSDNIKEDRNSEDLLIQTMLDLGIDLSSKIETEEIDDKEVFSVADGYLLACFDQQVSEETVINIAKRHPFYAVFRDSGMNNDSVATNFEQIFETYSSETVRRVL